MKLAIVRTFHSVLDINAYNIQEIGLAKALVKHGLDIDFYSRIKGLKNAENSKVIYKHNGNKVCIKKLNGIIIFNRFSYYPGLIKKLKLGKYDIIQLHEDSEIFNVFIIFFLKNIIPIKILYQGNYKNYTGSSRFLQFFYDLLLLPIMKRNIDIVFAKTHLAKDYLLKKGFANVSVLPVGYYYNELEEVEFLNKDFVLLLDKSEIIITYIGKLEKRRNVDFIIELINVLIELKKNQFGFIIVGDGPDKEKILQLKQTYTDKVFYIEKIENYFVKNILDKTNIFILPSDYEIFGMVILEALSSGVPVVSTKTAGPLEIIKNDILGKTLDLELKEWLDAIYYYAKDIETSDKNYRKDYIKKKYNWDNLSISYLHSVKEYNS